MRLRKTSRKSSGGGRDEGTRERQGRAELLREKREGLEDIWVLAGTG